MEYLNGVKFSMNFNLREPNKRDGKTNLYCVIKIDSKQIKLPMGCNVYAYQYNSKLQLCNVSANMLERDRANNIEVNQKIMAAKGKYYEIINYLCGGANLCAEQLENLFKNTYKDMANKNAQPPKRPISASKLLDIAFNLYYGNNEQSQGTKNNVQGHVKAYKEYLKNQSGVYDSPTALTQKALTAYKFYLEEQAKEMGKGNEHSICNKVNAIVRLANALNDNVKYNKYVPNKLNTYSFKKTVKRDEKKARNLTNEECAKLLSCKDLTSKEEMFLDAFKMQVESGVRYSDLHKLFNCEYEVQEENNKQVQVIKTQKNDIVAVIIVNDVIKDLQSKYQKGLPQFSESTYNNNLRTIARKAELNHTITYYVDLVGKKQEKEGVFSELIASHWARHTFITKMRDKGFPMDKLCYLTGHTDDTMIKWYYAHTNEEKEKQTRIKGVFEVLNSENSNANTSNSESFNVMQTIEKGKQEKVNELIEEYKQVLVFLGAKFEDIADINNLDKLVTLSYVDYGQELSKIGINVETLKGLWNSPNLKFKEKKIKLHELIDKANERLAESK